MSHIEESAVEDSISYTKKDFTSDQAVRWCPGCGDYAILTQVQTVLAEMGHAPHKVAMISGIGCSSRFPYYMGTYGFHTIHGRAPAFSTAVKCVNPELSVWNITGDGDGLSIGGNHLIHVLRRNVDINILLFNNEIYGLTKGQYSPTSQKGTVTKSTPYGSLDHPFKPLSLALGAEASFIARSVDTHPIHLRQTLKQAEGHRGTSFIEIYQNCLIFNDGAFFETTKRNVRDDRVLFLEHGKPMVFGKKGSPKGIRMTPAFKLEVIELGEEFSESDCIVHDVTNALLAGILVRMTYPEFPVIPMGIIYQIERETYDSAINAQLDAVTEKKGKGSLRDLIYGDATWTVE